MYKVLILVTCCFLAGSCSSFKKPVKGEFQEKYTITYETSGPNPPIQTHSNLATCPHYQTITLQQPPAPPYIEPACEHDAECVSDALAEYIKELRVIMASNRELVKEANKRYVSCQGK